MLLGILDASLLGHLLTGKDTIKAGEGTVIAGQDFLCHLNKFCNSKVLSK